MPKLLIFLLCLCLRVQAQDTTQALQSVTPTFESTSTIRLSTTPINSSSAQAILPHKMLVTQRIFWGPNGLLRLAGVAPLTVEGRRKELRIRQFMLITHKVTGYVTLAGFVAQGILGIKLNNATGSEYNQLYNLQQTTAVITNVAYGTTALLSLTAPPKLMSARKNVNGIKLHNYLSIIHLMGFIATTILASKANQNSEFRPYQQVANFTTLAAFAPALIALKF